MEVNQLKDQSHKTKKEHEVELKVGLTFIVFRLFWQSHFMPVCFYAGRKGSSSGMNSACICIENRQDKLPKHYFCANFKVNQPNYF